MRYSLALVLATGCGLFGSHGGGGGGGSGGGSPGTADQHQAHNLASLNAYRAQHGAAALVVDDQLNAFSTTAAQQLEASGQAHGYFIAQGNSGAIWMQGFCTAAGENQAPKWPVNGDEDGTVDAILQAMMNEGPGGGHYDNIVSKNFTRVGIGLVVDANQQLWFSNDFSGSCH
jgi:uncharacterized protein YkwD